MIPPLKDRLQRLQRQREAGKVRQRSLIHRLDQISLRCAARPILDRRSADEICGYDASGLPS